MARLPGPSFCGCYSATRRTKLPPFADPVPLAVVTADTKPLRAALVSAAAPLVVMSDRFGRLQKERIVQRRGHVSLRPDTGSAWPNLYSDRCSAVNQQQVRSSGAIATV